MPIITNVRTPPPVQDPPTRIAWFVLSGVALLVLALVAEFGVRPKPLVPASHAPGLLILCFGGAVAMAVVDRYLPRYGSAIYLLPMVVILFLQLSGRHSALPVLLYAGIFQILRPLARAIPVD